MDFNIKNLNIEKFKINFEDGKSLTLNPPKLSVLRKATGIRDLGETEEGIDELINIVALILNNNKEKKKITPAFVEDNFDIGELILFMKKYTEWISGIKQNPNF